MRLAVLVVIVAAIVAFVVPPVPQSLAYHHMADERAWLGIPNALNVLSNLPFAIVGLLGLSAIAASPFRDPWERWAYVALFGGVALTAAGSSYYHLAPDNARLVWDRLPMTIGFMGLVAAMMDERVKRGLAARLLVPLLLVGASSVAWWAWTESRGAGDLRLYGLVQFGSLAVVSLLLVLYREDRAAPARGGPGTRYVVAALALYGLAKV